VDRDEGERLTSVSTTTPKAGGLWRGLHTSLGEGTEPGG
jgi:hypothetical protein